MSDKSKFARVGEKPTSYGNQVEPVSRLRPHLVHRLDKHATGIMIVATNSYAARELSESLRNFGWRKKYIAEVEGIITQKQGRIDDPIFEKVREYSRNRRDFEENSSLDRASDRDVKYKLKRAITEYRVIGYRDGRTLLELRPITGRMHQLRQHCAKHLYPIVGDEKYWQKSNTDLVEYRPEEQALSGSNSVKDRLETDALNASQPAFDKKHMCELSDSIDKTDADLTQKQHDPLLATLSHSSFNRQGLRLRCVEISFEFRGKAYCYRC